MPFPFIDGKARKAPTQPVELPVPERARQLDPAGYLLDPKLVDAVNVALLLSQPLLLTGEPGTGKTQLAHRLAWELGYEPHVFNTKSNSVARDLFYTFDSMGRFHAAQTNEGSTSNLDYVSYNALGKAILLANPPEAVAHLVPRHFFHPGQRRSVVLIDEIDKAPRDFPNDLLHEVDTMAFRVPELASDELAAPREMRPVLVLTSNSERNLPDAFLRRCVFFNIPFPNEARLAEIVQSRLPALAQGGSALLVSAVEFFVEFRKLGLRKPPSTAELINWVQILVNAGANPDKPLAASPEALLRSLSALAKTDDDTEALAGFVKTTLGG